MPSIDDFLVLKYSDAIISNNTAIWNIAPTYYSNQRAPVCFMSLERCNIIFRGQPGQDDSSNVATMIRININGQNQQLTDNNETILDIVETRLRATVTQYESAWGGGISQSINVLGDIRNCAVKYNNPNPMRLLVSARPTEIKITIQNRDFVTFISAVDPVIDLSENYLILRFEYEDTRSTQREYSNQYNKTL